MDLSSKLCSRLLYIVFPSFSLKHNLNICLNRIMLSFAVRVMAFSHLLQLQNLLKEHLLNQHTMSRYQSHAVISLRFIFKLNCYICSFFFSLCFYDMDFLWISYHCSRWSTVKVLGLLLVIHQVAWISAILISNHCLKLRSH